jgi:hypothetical protein
MYRGSGAADPGIFAMVLFAPESLFGAHALKLPAGCYDKTKEEP